ncbi:hypothetical protein KSS87_022995, partial [Heliosperma pusillum]
GLKLPVRLVRKNEVEAFRAQEKEKVLQVLDHCTRMCAVLRVSCETTFFEKDSITEGILELIYQLRIEKLVMGAAANHKYWSGMTKLMSEKAKNVLQFAPGYCHVWFICKEQLIYKRESVMEQSLDTEEMPSNSSEIDNQLDSGILLTSQESRINDTLRNQLEQGISEAESSWCETFRESARFSNADKQPMLMEAIHKTKPVKSPCYEELRLKKVTKKEAGNLRILKEALGHKMSLESQVESLERKLLSEMALSQKYKNERDGALKEVQELRKQPQGCFFEFPYFELQRATNCFDPSLKIGEGGCGS